MIETPEKVITRGDVDSLNRAEAELCKRDLRYLCREILGFKDWDTCHDDMAQFLKEHDQAPRKLILVPREHLKTSIVTVGGAIQEIIRNPNVTILISNLVLSNAEKILSEIKECLMKPDMVAMFGDFVGPLWNRDEIVVKQRTSTDKTPTISIGSPDKVLTSQHFDIIILDDILDDSVLGTADQILKTRNYYSKIIDLLKRPHGKLSVVGTRYDDKDLYGTIMREMADEYKVFFRGATKDGTMGGELIFPKKFTHDILQKLLKEKGSYSFWSQYFNQVVSRENQQFKPPVRYWKELPEVGRKILTVDLAPGLVPGMQDNPDGDNNAITSTIFTPSNQLYVVKYRYGRFNVSETIDYVFDYVNSENPWCVGIEANAYQRVFIHMLNLEMKKRNKTFRVVPIVQHRDKFTRLMGLQPLWESGDILLKPGMVELEEEFDRFPRGMHDDIMDTLEMALHLVSGTQSKIEAPQPYDKLQDDFSRREWEVRAKERKRKEEEPDLDLASIGI